jgi:hypothetical protein
MDLPRFANTRQFLASRCAVRPARPGRLLGRRCPGGRRRPARPRAAAAGRTALRSPDRWSACQPGAPAACGCCHARPLSSSGPSACDHRLSLRPSQNSQGPWRGAGDGHGAPRPVPTPRLDRQPVLELLAGRVAAGARHLRRSRLSRCIGEEAPAQRDGGGLPLRPRWTGRRAAAAGAAGSSDANARPARPRSSAPPLRRGCALRRRRPS